MSSLGVGGWGGIVYGVVVVGGGVALQLTPPDVTWGVGGVSRWKVLTRLTTPHGSREKYGMTRVIAADARKLINLTRH